MRCACCSVRNSGICAVGRSSIGSELQSERQTRASTVASRLPEPTFLAQAGTPEAKHATGPTLTALKSQLYHCYCQSICICPPPESSFCFSFQKSKKHLSHRNHNLFRDSNINLRTVLLQLLNKSVQIGVLLSIF